MKRFTMVLGAGMFSILCSMILALVPSVAEGDDPKLINFQGLLRDGSGNPVVNGVYVIRFRIYDDSTAGSNLWEEFDDVQTTNGLFNVRLGDTTDLPNGLFEGSVNRFVGVKVGGDPESSPRTRLISVPFAFHALKSDSAATATVALDLTCSGCVGTGDIDATQVQRRVTGTAPPVPRFNSPGIAYVLAAGLKKGDVVEVTLLKDGKPLLSNSETLTEGRERHLLQAGKRGVPAGGWPDGKYQAVVKITRDGKTLIEQDSAPIPFE